MKLLLYISILLTSCHVFEPNVRGCTTSTACNYDINADFNDGSCLFLDCEGLCSCGSIDENGNGYNGEDCTITDECGICGGIGISENTCDCNGNTLDCAGECGGTATIDDCGMCSGGNTEYIANSQIDCHGQCFAGTPVGDSIISSFGSFNTIENNLGQGELNGCGVCYGGIIINEDAWEEGPTEYVLIGTYFQLNGADCNGVCGGFYEVDCNGNCTEDSGCYLNNCELYPSYVGQSSSFPLAAYDCSGDCIANIDCNNICGGSEANDCFGICGGNAIIDNCGECEGNNDSCSDCNGIINGSAFIDDCDQCVGGTTGNVENYLLDECGVCGGDNSSCSDCAGTPNTDPNGWATFDECSGECCGGITGIACSYFNEPNLSQNPPIYDYDGLYDCNGVCSGDAYKDLCGVCVEGTTNILPNLDEEGCGCFVDPPTNYYNDNDSDGWGAGEDVLYCSETGIITTSTDYTLPPDGWVPNNNDLNDNCPNTDPNVEIIIDECGVCDGDNSSCTGCWDELAFNYCSECTIECTDCCLYTADINSYQELVEECDGNWSISVYEQIIPGDTTPHEEALVNSIICVEATTAINFFYESVLDLGKTYIIVFPDQSQIEIVAVDDIMFYIGNWEDSNYNINEQCNTTDQNSICSCGLLTPSTPPACQ